MSKRKASFSVGTVCSVIVIINVGLSSAFSLRPMSSGHQTSGRLTEQPLSIGDEGDSFDGRATHDYLQRQAINVDSGHSAAPEVTPLLLHVLDDDNDNQSDVQDDSISKGKRWIPPRSEHVVLRHGFETCLRNQCSLALLSAADGGTAASASLRKCVLQCSKARR